MPCVVPSYRIFTPPDGRTWWTAVLLLQEKRERRVWKKSSDPSVVHQSEKSGPVGPSRRTTAVLCCEVASRCRPVVGCCVSLSHGASKDARVLVEVFFLANQSVIIRRAHDYTARHQFNHPSSGVGLPVTLAAAAAAELIDS